MRYDMKAWQKWIITVVFVGVVTGGAWLLFGDRSSIFSGGGDVEIDLDIKVDDKIDPEVDLEAEEAQ
jgi:hypothetical protein